MLNKPAQLSNISKKYGVTVKDISELLDSE